MTTLRLVFSNPSRNGAALALVFGASLLLAVGTYSTPALAEDEPEKCSVPEAPEIPDGSTAPESELVKTQGKVKEYLDAGDAFLACLERRDAALEGDESEEALSQRALILHLHNQFVDQMQGVGDRFNESVKAYKAR